MNKNMLIAGLLGIVSYSNAQTILIDFGASNKTTSTDSNSRIWNNVSSARLTAGMRSDLTALSAPGNLVTSSGADSGFTFSADTHNNNVLIGGSVVDYTGPLPPNPTGSPAYDSSVLDSLFVDDTGNGEIYTVRIGELDDTRAYEFTFLSAFNGGGGNGDIDVALSVGTTNDRLTASPNFADNATNVAEFFQLTGIRPLNGVIELNFSSTLGNNGRLASIEFTSGEPAPDPEPVEGPNVVFILIDDFGWMDVGYNGSTFHETPVMDQLSTEWMRFDRCYTPNPMCSPTRVSIMTGTNPARHGVTLWLPGRETSDTRPGEEATVLAPPPKSPGIREEEITIGEAFQEAGYDTAFYGKWHMGKLAETGGPANHGFNSESGVIQENSARMVGWNQNLIPDISNSVYFNDALTTKAIQYMELPRRKPFYLHLSHFSMHVPIQAKPALRAHFQNKANLLPPLDPPALLDDYANSPHKLRQDDAEYAGQLFNLDENIGRVVDYLKNADDPRHPGEKMIDNTIIVLTGDNGGRSGLFKPSAAHPTSSEPLRGGKTLVFEGGIRTPTMIYWPGHTTPGMSSDTPIVSMDFYPTLLEMAGLPLKPAQHVDGLSLVSLFNGGSIERESIIWHFPHYNPIGGYPASAIRKGDFKLIYNYHFGDYLLYDIVNDPFEKTNLAPSMPEKVESMLPELINFLKEHDATLPRWLIENSAPKETILQPFNSTSQFLDISWDAILNESYSVEACVDLSDSGWERIEVGIQGIPPVARIRIPNSNEPRRFFRIAIE